MTDNHGEIEVPLSPERVVALDNTTFQTLNDWKIPVTAVPKPLMHDLWSNLTGGAEVLDVGSHREPDLEAVIQADPDLIVGGYRFASFYDDLKQIQPAIIETSPREGEVHITELKRQVGILGQVFDRTAEADKLAAALDDAVAAANGAYNGTDTVTGLITSGGKISFAAPGEGRGVGSLFPTLGLAPAIDKAAEDASHGDDISVEAIAAANPQWLIVLDRDATFGEEGYVAAKELIEGSEALAQIDAVKKGQIVYEAIEFLSLGDLQHRYLDQLSGGQRQRAYVAMVLAQDTDCILLDEPLNNLDMRHGVAMMKQLRRAADELGKTIVIVIHDINFAAAYADRIVALADGTVVHEGSPDELMTSTVLERVFDTRIDVRRDGDYPLAVYFR